VHGRVVDRSLVVAHDRILVVASAASPTVLGVIRTLFVVGSPTTIPDSLSVVEPLPRDIRPARPGEYLGALVLPGSSTLARSPVLGALLLILGVAAPLAVLGWAAWERDRLIALGIDDRFLGAVVIVGAVAMLARAVAVGEVMVSQRNRGGRLGITGVLAGLAVVALAVPAVWGIVQVERARALLDDVFAGTADPIFTGDGDVDGDGVRTVLILGGDTGPGRPGLRTDTMILAVIDEASGRTGLISVPRNLEGLQFPPDSALGKDFPDGFPGIANAVYAHVEARDPLKWIYGWEEIDPGARALAEGIGYSLGIGIDDIAIVEMQGFRDLVDSVGGVTVVLDRELPLPPDLPGIDEAVPTTIGPGPVRMDGTLALAFVRSRYADSDYQRMGRQRQLLAALVADVGVVDAVTGFSDAVSTLRDTVRTTLTRDEFADLADAASGGGRVVESVGLVPPVFQPASRDFEGARFVVDVVVDAVVSGEPSGLGAPG
jgi:LCP family protein required for cell wall assembly